MSLDEGSIWQRYAQAFDGGVELGDCTNSDLEDVADGLQRAAASPQMTTGQAVVLLRVAEALRDGVRQRLEADLAAPAAHAREHQ